MQLIRTEPCWTGFGPFRIFGLASMQQECLGIPEPRECLELLGKYGKIFGLKAAWKQRNQQTGSPFCCLH